jgi:tRNA (guanine10-N2)-dimethyltransferase
MLPLENPEESDAPRRLFFILSGEHATLPAAEILAILDSESIPHHHVESSYRLLKLDAPPQALQDASNRSLMYDKCGYLLGECEADNGEIHKLIRDLPLDKYVAGAATYAVRSERLGGVKKEIKRTQLERSIGSQLKEKAPSLRVRLKEPELTFLSVIYEESFLFGLTQHAKPSGPISRRRPRKRPVFHPSTMPPKIARCMVNLSRARPGRFFADPFCGVGGIVIEASLIGCRVVAVDASSRMLRGAGRNVAHFSLQAAGMVNGDARFLPLHDLDSIATDPPYGRDSSTRGVNVNELIRQFLQGAFSSMKHRAHICVSAPSEVQLADYARDAGFHVKEQHLARIHRSLTRQFIVAEAR